MTRLLAFAFLLVALVGCTRTPTEMVVVVRSDIRTLHDVRITVRREPATPGADAIVDHVSRLEGDGAETLPLAQPIRPANETDDRPLRITVTANDGYPDAFGVSVVVPFVAHEVIELPLFLADACRDASVRARCEATGQVCGAAGACAPVQVNVIDPGNGATSPASGVDARVVIEDVDAASTVDVREAGADAARADVRDASADVTTVDASDARDASADVTTVDARTDTTVVTGDASDARTADADAAVDATSPADATDATDAMDAIDPCAIANGGCDLLTTCTSTADARSCSACPTSYTGTGATQCTWNDPSLSALVPSDGALSPAFTSATTDYEITVGLATVSLGLQPGVSMPAASAITVDGASVPSGRSSVARALALGDTVFRVVVSAAGGATRTYTVTVHRALRVLQQAYAKASNTGAGDYFGISVALDGDTLAVGAIGEASNATGIDGNQGDDSTGRAGAVYVFTRTGSTWSQQAYVKASNTGASDDFGISVALDGDTLAVGANREASNATGVNGNAGNNSAAGSGAVYVFTRAGNTWTQRAYVKASNTGAGDHFGYRLALANDTLAVGAYDESSNATGIDGNQGDNSAASSGAVYVFVRNGTVWTQQAYVKASNTGAHDQFGWSIALANDTLAVGAIGESSNATGVGGNQGSDSASYAGAVYVFTRAGTVWIQQAYVKAGNTEAIDQFGYSVALAGDTLAVGAIGEASSATGIDGDGTDDSATGSGAVYVFVRAGTLWSQQAYVKAGNTGAGDSFGVAVALDGDTLAVGAYGEASRATGIDGDGSDNGAVQSGAVYVFTRAASTWVQRAYVKAGNTGAGDYFGYGVALDGNTFVVGAYDEDGNATGIDGNGADNSATDSGAVYLFTL